MVSHVSWNRFPLVMKLALLCVALAFNIASAFVPAAAAGQRAQTVRMSAEHFGRRELLTKLVGGIAIATAFSAPSSVLAVETAEAVFAGGCFWCMEVRIEHDRFLVPCHTGAQAPLKVNTLCNCTCCCKHQRKAKAKHSFLFELSCPDFLCSSCYE